MKAWRDFKDIRFNKGYWERSPVKQGERIWLKKYGFRFKGLDIGCGIGRLMTKDMIGITLNDYEIKVCMDKGLKVIKSDGRALPFSNKFFSEVLCAFVLEHMLPQDALIVVKEIHRVLKPGGKAFILTEQFNKDFFSDYTHIHPFTKGSLQQLMRDGGFQEFEVVRIMPMVKGYNFIGRTVGEKFLYILQIITRPIFLNRCKLLAIGIKE